MDSLLGKTKQNKTKQNSTKEPKPKQQNNLDVKKVLKMRKFKDNGY